MSAETIDLWKRLGVLMTAVSFTGGLVWAASQRNADLSHIEWRANIADVRLTEHERDLSEIRGDLKAIKQAVERIERNLKP